MARPLLFLTFILLYIVVSATAHGGDHGGDDDSADTGSDSSADEHDLRARSLILVKIWCLILVFVGTFAGGISPYFLKWNEGFLALGTQFAGGVFLGTALMHFLSDSNETFEDLTKKEYPFAFMLASAGYLLTMLVDCFIVYIYGKQGNVGSSTVAGHLQHHQGVAQNGKGSSNGRTSQLEIEVHDNSDHYFSKASLVTAASLGDSILLIIALCFHSVFEGIAIGVAEPKLMLGKLFGLCVCTRYLLLLQWE